MLAEKHTIFFVRIGCQGQGLEQGEDVQAHHSMTPPGGGPFAHQVISHVPKAVKLPADVSLSTLEASGAACLHRHQLCARPQDGVMLGSICK